MRRRILLAIVGVAAGAVLLLAVPLAIGVGQLYREQEVVSLERDATAAARGFDARAESGDPVEFPPSPDALAAYDAEGRRLSGDGPPMADEVVRSTLTSGTVTDGSTDGRLIAAVPLLAHERIVGAVRASRSTAELDERVLRVRLTIAGVAVLIIAIAAAAALVLARRLTRPVGELAATAARIEEGQVAVAAPRSGIEELDQVADALEDSAARLAEVLARERALSADASHQLRTPLAALRLELESRQLAGDDVDEPLRQVERLEGTIETLLAAARDVASGRDPFAIEPLLEQVRRAWTGPLAEHGRALEIAAREPLPRVHAAEGAVREVLEVLVDNAARHGDGTVRVQARVTDASLAIDVADEGRGIAEPEGAFARRSGSGHGIGLALARSLVEADGGRLDLADARAGRTRFTLLYRAEVEEPSPPAG